MAGQQFSFDVRVWAVSTYHGARATSYTVKWRVQGRRFRKTFRTKKLAEAFRAELLVATRAGSPFSVEQGVPESLQEHTSPKSWLEHVMDYVLTKWSSSSPRHRRGIAEALTDVTLAVTPLTGQAPSEPDARRVLFRWAFNAAARARPLEGEDAQTLAWLERHSPPLQAFKESAVLRSALDRLALRQDGRAAAASTVARKRATLHNALEYAVEIEAFTSNPLHKVRWKAPKTSEVVDQRVVVNPDQARALLRSVWEHDPSLAAFFACMYFAGMRPAEALALREGDCHLPDMGWGHLLLARSHQNSGAAWTDSATTAEERGLKHRSSQDTRLVPAHADLVATLRRHLNTFASGVDGQLFVARTGRAGVPVTPPYANPVGTNSIYRAWHHARATALTEEQQRSMLARRPYDLRHACLSTWLNAGVPPARVAQWAGHSVEVLLRIYANCVEGDDQIALTRITEALQ